MENKSIEIAKNAKSLTDSTVDMLNDTGIDTESEDVISELNRKLDECFKSNGIANSHVTVQRIDGYVSLIPMSLLGAFLIADLTRRLA